MASDEEISRASSCGSIGEPVKSCASISRASTALLPPLPRSIETRVGNRKYIDLDTVGTLSRGDYYTIVKVWHVPKEPYTVRIEKTGNSFLKTQVRASSIGGRSWDLIRKGEASRAAIQKFINFEGRPMS